MVYAPFGEVRSGTLSTLTDFGYTGQRLDRSTDGLMFYNARYYLPELKRFISPDTIVPSAGNPQALNRFAYVINNPVKLSDPTGHFYEMDDAELQFLNKQNKKGPPGIVKSQAPVIHKDQIKTSQEIADHPEWNSFEPLIEPLHNKGLGSAEVGMLDESWEWAHGTHKVADMNAIRADLNTVFGGASFTVGLYQKGMYKGELFAYFSLNFAIGTDELGFLWDGRMNGNWKGLGSLASFQAGWLSCYGCHKPSDFRRWSNGDHYDAAHMVYEHTTSPSGQEFEFAGLTTSSTPTYSKIGSETGIVLDIVEPTVLNMCSDLGSTTPTCNGLYDFYGKK
jgi:RHS repeat-associated protein